MIGEVLVTILWGLLIVVGVVLALVLIVPLHFRAEGEIDSDDDRLMWNARVAWGFGFLAVKVDGDGMVLRLVGIPIARSRRRGEREARLKKPRPKKPRKAKKDAERGRRGLGWFMRRRRLLARIAGRYVRAFHIKGGVEGVVGLSDPGQTAQVHQVLVVLDAVLPDGVVQVDVDWVEEIVQLSGRVGGWVWPLQVVGISLALVLNRKAWRALRAEEVVS